MTGFAKIYESILDSSLWDESMETRLVWITMLAMADSDGFVRGSVKAVARRARVPLDKTVEALTILESPDESDASGLEEGRRLIPKGGGWLITTHSLYRSFRTPKQKADAARQAKSRKRKRDNSPPSRDVTRHHANAEAEAEAEAEADTKEQPLVVGGNSSSEDVPNLSLEITRPDPVDEYWAHVLQLRRAAGLAGRSPDLASRRATIRRRLKKFTLEELKAATSEHLRPDGYHVQNSYTTPDQVLRSDKRVESFLERAANPPRHSSKNFTTPEPPKYQPLDCSDPDPDIDAIAKGAQAAIAAIGGSR